MKQIKLQKKDNLKELKAVERCLERDRSTLDAEMEYWISVDDMVELAEIEKDEVPENSYQVQKNSAAMIMSADDLQSVTVRPVSELLRDNIQAYEEVKLPSNKADYMRMSLAEKVSCYLFDKQGTEAAFDTVKAYFETVDMDTDFHAVYEETMLLTDYCEKQKAEEFIQKRAEQAIEKMEMLGIDADKFTEYSEKILSEVFDFGDMEYFAGMKLFNQIIDRLGVHMTQQRRYEVFDRAYEEGMREKKDEQNRNRY